MAKQSSRPPTPPQKMKPSRPAPILPANDTRDFSTTGTPVTKAPGRASKPAPPHPELDSVSKAQSAATRLPSRPAPILPANDTRDFSTTGPPSIGSVSTSKPAPPHPELDSVSKAQGAKTKLKSRPAPKPAAQDTRDYSTTGRVRSSAQKRPTGRGNGRGNGGGAVVRREPDVHVTALERFKLSAQAFQEQRQREYDDLRFAANEQWPSDVKAQRTGGQTFGSLPPAPARPMLTINKLLQPIKQLSNTMRQAQLSIKFAPKGDGASQETANLFEDLVRAIQDESRAHIARQWAFDRAITCGRGFYRILTDYDEDDPGEQKIVWKRILNQAAVYPDPFAQEPDWSDGEWCFITDWYSVPRYIREFGTTKLARALETRAFADIVEDNSAWFRTTADGSEAGRAIQIAEYFYCVYPKDEYGRRGKRQVKWLKINAQEVLETRDWPGCYIPIIPVIADEHNLNGERRWEGIVRPARGAQESYNYMRSAQVETIGLAPRAPYILDPKQIIGFREWWDQSNIRNFPFLPAISYNERGQPYPEIRRQVEEPAIQAITLATREADNDIKAVSGFFDPSLGNMDPHARSGKAVIALQKQQELGSAGYIGNLSEMSMLYEGKVLKDLIPKIYDTDGRIVATLGDDGQRGLAMLNVPYVMQDGQPRPAHPMQLRDRKANKVKTLDLSRGLYTVSVAVGKGYSTRREEAVASMGDLAEAAPQMVPAYADLWVKNMDFPGASQIAERLRRALPPQFQDPQEGQPDIPPQLLQQMQFAQKMIDELSAQLKQSQEVIQNKVIEAQRDMAQHQQDNAVKLEIAKIQAGATLGVADIKAQTDAARAAAEQLRTIIETAEESRRQMQQMAHETANTTQSHLHDRILSAQEHLQTLQQGAQQGLMASQQQADQNQADRIESAQAHGQALVEADQAHRQALEQGEQANQATQQQQAQQAALNPPAESEGS